MDPRHGELSPAMRNRGVEIFLENAHTVPDNQMMSTMKDSTRILQGQIPIDKFAYYSNASIVTRRFELMKNLQAVSAISYIIRECLTIKIHRPHIVHFTNIEIMF